jgi:GT2 family glycosyltransferase
MLADTLRSLLACRPTPDEVIVVDGSEGATAAPVVQAMAGAGPRLRHVASPPGLCRQRNRGAAEAAGDVIVFLDDDVLLRPNTIGALVQALADPSVVGATGRVEEPDPRRLSFKRSALRRLLPGAGRQGTMTRYGYPNRLRDLDEPRDLEFLSGCLMAARAQHVRELGFDEALEALAGYALAEDEDFGYRLSRRGRLRYVPAAVVEHRNFGFSSSRSREFNRQLAYNRRYLFRKSFPQTRLARAQWWTAMGVHLLHRGVNRDWQGMLGLAEGLRLGRRA